MKIKSLFLVLFLGCIGIQTCIAVNQKTYFDGKEEPLKYGKIKCLSLCLGENQDLSKVASIIGENLEFTDQFEVEVKKFERDLTNLELLKLFKSGIPYVLFLREISDSKSNEEIKVRAVLKDTASNKVELEEEFKVSRWDLVYLGNLITSKISLILTGKKGIFLYKLAYCKLLSQWHKVICMSDYACRGEHPIVLKKGIHSFPCWHTVLRVLFYTKLTKSSNRLMAIDINTGRHKVICSFKGLNMQPTVSEDGKKIALCLARTGNSELYLYDQNECKKRKEKVFKQITRNDGNNVSPNLLPNGNIVFCSDFELGIPHLYYLNIENGSSRRLTQGGYSASPSYCKNRNSVVFTKSFEGTFQLFALNLNDLEKGCKEEQLTFGKGDKRDPFWSECGDYIYFSFQRSCGKGEQVAVFNVASKNTRVLTSGKEQKSFPILRRFYTEKV